MNLQIRDPRARELARRLADRRGISMTEAVVEALEAELARDRSRPPLAARLNAIADRLKAKGQPGGHDMAKDEIDAMWGHS